MRLPTRTMSALVVGAALLVCGCEAQVHSSPPEDTPQAPVVAPPASLAPLPVAPPAAPLAGLDARMQEATAAAAEYGAQIETVVLDRTTGQVVSNGGGIQFPIASVAKLFIADDLLLRAAEDGAPLSAADRASLDSMLRSSDDGAAQTFWERGGQNAILSRVVARYGLTGTTAPSNAHWDVTLSTASDLVRYYDMLLDGSGGLPRPQADIIVGNLARSTPTGLDGYPQRFGIPDGLSGEPVAVKQGWFCCWGSGDQLHVSTGIIGPERRYVMAISSLDPSGDAAAREHLTEAVETMFPGGKI